MSVSKVLLTLAGAAFLFVSSPDVALTAEAEQSLKNRVIRALALGADNKARVFVGNKSSKPGSGFVFKSKDSGQSWAFLNGSKPLTAKANDVQAVVDAGKGVVLAGTWKHGLFISSDDGKSFNAHPASPSKDIRSFASADGKVFLATGNAGVFVSTDNGSTWQNVGLKGTFIWSITASTDGEHLLASSPADGVFESTDGGQTWAHTLNGKKSYQTIKLGDGSLLSATETGLMVRAKDGKWSVVVGTEKTRFSSLLDTGKTIFAGRWEAGVTVYNPTSGKTSNTIDKLPVVHLAANKDTLFIGTWGKGLYRYKLADLLKAL